ncbi:hypothetical protein LCGC14_1078700 [marine sediment metagenome]|uniref:Uncharacterized protein n=1 Tax=marine sediment metagenome TaxID=412755 RepID=A0A0F9PZ86_9ZZZZ
MSIKEVMVRKDCPICDGRENGYYDCGSKGYIEEWMSIVEFINSMKFIIEHSEGIA